MGEFLNKIANFCNHPFFSIWGGISILLVLIALGDKIICSFFGITPVVRRLGTGLSRRKIAICSTANNFESLKSTLVESGLFKAKNIKLIQKDNIERAKEETLLLVDWETVGDVIDQIFTLKKSYQSAVVIYAKPGKIPHEKMDYITDRPNTVVVNSRGRLLNDILTSLITTSHQKK